MTTSPASVHEENKEPLSRRELILMSVLGLGLATFSTTTGDASQSGEEESTALPFASLARYEVRGAIRNRFEAEGGEAVLGLPITAELPTLGGGCYQIFEKDGERTRIVWSEKTGAHSMLEDGAISRAWRLKGAERGYGFPTGQEESFGIYSLQSFSSGVVLARNTVTGEVTVHH